MKEKQTGGWKQVKCSICGKSLQSRALVGHTRFMHGSAVAPLKKPDVALGNAVIPLKKPDAAGTAAGLIAEKKRLAELRPPHVYKVEKLLDKTLTTRRKIKDLESMRTVKKGLLNGDDSVDLALKELHRIEAEAADGFRLLEEALPSKTKGIGNAWLLFGLAIAALGLPRLIDYLNRKKTESAAAETKSIAADVGGVGSLY